MHWTSDSFGVFDRLSDNFNMDQEKTILTQGEAECCVFQLPQMSSISASIPEARATELPRAAPWHKASIL